MNEILDYPEPVLERNDHIRLQHLAVNLDRNGTFPGEAFDLISRNRHFHLFVPKERGGLDLPLVEGMRIIEGYAAIEGNLGWIVQIGAGGGVFSAYLEEEVSRTFLGQPHQVIAGSDFVGGQARPVADGYLVSGEWNYASGACHATAFTGNCLISSGPLEGQVRAVIVPAASVEIIPSWNAMGMRATDSHSFRMREVFVPESHLFLVDPEHLLIANRTTSLPFQAFARALFLPVLTGEVYRYQNLFGGLLSHRSSGVRAQDSFSHLKANLKGSRFDLFQLAGQIWQEGETRSDGPGPDDRFAELSVRITDDLILAVDHCHRYTGMAGVHMEEALNISYRNIKTVVAHRLLRP